MLPGCASVPSKSFEVSVVVSTIDDWIDAAVEDSSEKHYVHKNKWNLKYSHLEEGKFCIEP